jgi:hypothetical protein
MMVDWALWVLFGAALAGIAGLVMLGIIRNVPGRRRPIGSHD